MNEELQKALAGLLGKANDGIDTASDFLVAELPDVIQQLLMWHGVHSLVMSVFGIIVLIIMYKVNKKQYYWWTSKDDFFDYLPLAFGNALQIFPLFWAVNRINIEWLQIWIAPKVWLIEYAAKLAN